MTASIVPPIEATNDCAVLVTVLLEYITEGKYELTTKVYLADKEFLEDLGRG
jgi:hypothetical protein